MKPLAIIPARLNSKRVPRKNMRLLAGKPLVAWTIESALEADIFEHVVVSTDSQETANIAKDYGAEVPFLRPAHLATDKSTTLATVQDVVRRLQSEREWIFDDVMTLQPTSPVRRPHRIQESMSAFDNDLAADSLVSCCEVPRSFRPNEVMQVNASRALESAVRSIDDSDSERTSSVLARNGAAIYITRVNRIKEYLLGGRMIPYMMTLEDSIDIDTEFDFRLAESEMLFRQGR